MAKQQLTEGEQRVLEEMHATSGKVSAEELSKRTGDKKERVISILNSLDQRKLVSLEIEEIPSYHLTDEGFEYESHGLPEIRLFNAVKELQDRATLDDAVERGGLTAREKGIAINWARKKGWLKIGKENGDTVLETVTKNADSEIEALLSHLSKNGDVPEDLEQAKQEALSRTLIEESTRKRFEAEIIDSEMVRSLISEKGGGVIHLTPDMIMEGTWEEVEFKPFNVEAHPAPVFLGRKHPYAEFNDWLKEILIGLGFEEWFGPYVETEFWNNDALFVPQDHVSREIQDQFRVNKPYSHGDIVDNKYYRAVKSVHEDGGNTGSMGYQSSFSKEVSTRLCLRSHTTPVSMRFLHDNRLSPQKMFIIDRNFRSEKLSASHAMEFNQCEGIIMDANLTLKDLMGYITEIVESVGIEKMKFKPGQFPFTEPSIECFAKHEELGWIEVAPGGIFRPEVTAPLGIKDSVLAWGIGSGRLYMASMGISDIRELYSRDLSWIRRNYFLR
ncbi:phenylalanine--tRNA ligase subunit alpha [Candidatus Thorarchaeota archaeon]|nr:MAG: phenylalanine--tRNA ligase subunit alpha [Candidatus Thorarchaeota archaeon]